MVIRCLLIFFLFLYFSVSYSNNSYTGHSVERVSESFGMGDLHINAIEEDTHGFIWARTTNGLLKYDGKNYYLYSEVIKDSSTFFLEEIRTIYAYDQENLLIGTHFYGVVRYEYKTNQLIHVPLDISPEVLVTCGIDDFETDDQGNIWLSYYKGIAVLNSNFEMIRDIPIHEVTSDTIFEGIFDIEISKSGDVYCTDRFNGVYCLKKGHNKFEKIYPLQNTVPADERYYRLAEASLGNMLVITMHSGVIEFSPDGKKVNQYWTNTKSKGLEFWGLDVVDSTIYIGGINSGLHQVEIGKPETVSEITLSIIANNNNPVSVSNIMNDHYGNTWVASHRPGLYKINRTTPFKSSFPEAPRNWLSGYYVNCFFETGSILWMGTDGNGLLYFDRSSNTYGRFTEKDGLSSNVILDIEQMPDGNLWLATWSGGLSVINPETFNIHTYKHTSQITQKTVSSHNIKALSLNRDTLWIPTHNNGLDFYSHKTGKFTSKDIGSEHITYDLTTPNWGNLAYTDSQGSVWLGTNVGLFQLDKGKTKRYLPDPYNENSLYDREVLSCHEASDGKLWVGSKSGLQYFTKDRNTVTRIPQSIVSFSVNSIISGSDHELYIGSSNGLFCLNTETLEIEKFSIKDGLSSECFRERSVYKAKDGTIYWGTTNGVCYKPAKNQSTDAFQPKIYINSLEVTDEYDSVTLGMYNVFTDTTFSIPHDHSRIDVFLGTLDIPDDHNAVLSYRIEGIDSVFHKLTGNRFTYSKTSAGNYNLIIRAQYEGQIYERNVFFKILPPFWQRAWFYIIEVLFITALGYGLYRIRVKQLKKQKRRLQLEVEHKTQQLTNQNNKLANTNEELEDAYTELQAQSEEVQETNKLLEKTNETQQELVSVLAHDVKNSFASIKGFTELLKTTPENLPKYLPHISNGADISSLLLNNLLLWFQSQTDDLNLQIQEYNLSLLLKEAIEQNEANAEIKGIAIESSYDESILVKADKNSFVLSIRNLLHNAIKFSHNDSCVKIETIPYLEKKSVSIFITDYGIGMNKADQVKFNNGSKVHSQEGTAGEGGTGVGLEMVKKFIHLNGGSISVNGIKGSGTVFSIQIPIAGLQTKEVLSDKDKTEKKEVITSVLSKFTRENYAKTYTVLLVEDNFTFRTQMSTKLKRFFTVLEASNGREAVKQLHLSKTDLVVTDFMMPHMQGDELVKHIKTDPQFADIPVVVFTAGEEEKYTVRALEAGADGCVLKSENTNKLILKLLNIARTRSFYKDKLAEKTSAPPLQVKKTDVMSRVTQLIEDNFADPSFSVERLAELMHIQRSHLYRKVKSASKKTPVELLVTYRLEKSLIMLQSKQYSVSDVAYLCGFSAPSYFSTKFKAKYGFTPTDVLNGKEQYEKVV